ncbi:hypothetical protein PV327_001908 [Microctonus hyperodae]|uniref:Uncharacterized protein n=1 Tax=Microctonus hyperodae TaxID=165561 RepID=A0AA39KNJ3_MICHY|nr:hypothetical protein PV327_001908 [Microctonus hyperodae]
MKSSASCIWALVLVLIGPNRGLGFFGGRDVVRGESGVKIGTNERGTLSRGLGLSRGGSGRGSGVRLGEGRGNITRQRPPPFTSTSSTTTTTPQHHFTHAPPSSAGGNSPNITYLKVGMVVPYKSFGVREYTKAVTTAISALQRSTRGPKLELFQRYDIHVLITMKELTPSPTGK